jgi:UDP-glucuronate 4-epimerase
MKILVTGAAGFIGSHLCEALLKERHSVTGVDNFDPYYDRHRKERNLAAALSDAEFTFLELDLRDAAATSSLFAQGWDCVVHLAGRGGVRRSIAEPRAYLEINYGATLNVLEGMRQAGVKKLVFASTSSVYGNSPRAPFREEDSTDRPMSPYSATKKACEVLCHTYHHLYGMDIWALRFFTVYGPRQRPDMAIHRFVRAILRRECIERFGDGSTHRDYTYVDDITAGVVKAVERVNGYEIINIGGAATTSLSHLIETLERLLGTEARIVEKPIPPGDVLRTEADPSKALRMLDFEARVGLDEGLKRFIDWYQKEHLS